MYGNEGDPAEWIQERDAKRAADIEVFEGKIDPEKWLRIGGNTVAFRQQMTMKGCISATHCGIFC